MSSCTVSSSLSCPLHVAGTWKGLPWSSWAHPAYSTERPDLWLVSTLAAHEVLCCPCPNSRSWLLRVACPCPSVTHDWSFVVAYMQLCHVLLQELNQVLSSHGVAAGWASLAGGRTDPLLHTMEVKFMTALQLG